MKNNILFLDIDGVLNITSYNRDQYGSLFELQFLNNLYHIYHNVENLQIVISSSWRKSGWEVIKEMWDYRGITIPLLDITPSIKLKRGMIGFFKDLTDNEKQKYGGYSIPRGCEIEYWLKEEMNYLRHEFCSKDEFIKIYEKSKINNYVILDDDVDFLYSQRDHFIRCSKQNEPDAIEGMGLTLSVANKAIDILNKNIIELYYGDKS